ncbi:transposase [Halomicroarcula sp. GCM10025709]|uniref:transposase n=1 Tax=Haloarcula TaxID=2237 RepID=UPI003615FBD6
MPANLCQQIRGPTLRDEHIDWHHRSSGGAAAPPLPAVTSSYCSNSPTIRYRRAPPYSPTLNAIEPLWKNLKRDISPEIFEDKDTFESSSPRHSTG